MKKIAIIGAGGWGREVALLVAQINKVKPSWELLGFYDDNLPPGTKVDGAPVLGKVENLNAIDSNTSVVVAVASPRDRKEIVGRISNPHVSYPSIVHPNANPGHPGNGFGQGCVISEGCTLTVGVTLRDFVILNLASTIGHDVELGQFTSVMPGCHISGNVKVGSGTLIGTGATVLQNISIGGASVIGAGAVVTKSFPPRSKLLGVPAKNMNE